MESLPIMKGLCISNQMSRYLKILGQMSIILQILAYLLPFFLWCWGLNQSLCLEPHHKPPSLFLMCFLRYSHKNYCHGLTLNHISPSLVARITGVSHWLLAYLLSSKYSVYVTNLVKYEGIMFGKIYSWAVETLDWGLKTDYIVKWPEAYWEITQAGCVVKGRCPFDGIELTLAGCFES
jgi:hypothetical protein